MNQDLSSLHRFLGILQPLVFEHEDGISWSHLLQHHLWLMVAIVLLIIALTVVLLLLRHRLLTLQKISKQSLLLLESAGEGICGVDQAGLTTFVNPAAEKILGYATHELIGKNLHAMTHHTKRNGSPYPRQECPMAQACLDGTIHQGIDEYFIRKDGSSFPIAYSSRPVMENGKIRGAVVCFTDITEHKRSQEMLRTEQEKLKAIFAASPVGMLLLDEETMIVDANDAMACMVSKSLNQIINHRPGNGLDCSHRHDHEKGCGFSMACKECPLRNNIMQVLQSGKSVRGAEIQTNFSISDQQRQQWLRISAEPLMIENQKHVIVAIEDISQRKALESELVNAARTDKLTGLPNRALICDRLQQAVLRANRLKDYQFAVLFLDFDRFKTINDSLGHNIGDLLLQEIATRLRTVVRTGDSLSLLNEHTTARLGGDEFVILLDGISQPEDATLVADRLLDIFSKPYHLGEHEVYSTASIGIVTSNVSLDSAEDVLRDADTAMYEAKLAGKGQYVVFDLSMRQRVQNRLSIETELRKAIDLNQLMVMYQPIVSLQTGKIESFEALVRWMHPQLGFVTPGEFIPIAEETGLILIIGEWVLRESCKQFATWQRTLGCEAAPSISVNLSRNQLLLPGLPALVRQVLHECEIAPACLHLEVTESAVMKDVKTATRILHEIKNIGVKIAMDDFGTGYSSLSCLHQFPIDILKIDRSFVMNIDRGRDYAALVQAVAQLARNLNIQVVAEGIETVEQALVLQSLDCEFGQGYLMGNPMPAEIASSFVIQPGVFPGQEPECETISVNM